MYTCDQALELLSARLDGALTPEETAGLEEHWTNARSAGRWPPTWRSSTTPCRGCTRTAPELKERVMAQIRAENAHLPGRGSKEAFRAENMASWGAMAAVMAVVFMSAVAMRFGHDGDTAGMPENTPVQSAAVYSVQPEKRRRGWNRGRTEPERGR